MVQDTLESAVEFADNPEPRCPCILLLDNSGSMAGDKLNALNEGLAAFEKSLKKDPLASRRVEVAIVTFGNQVNLVQDFVTVDNFQSPVLSAGGQTPMGEAILKALDMVANRKAVYKQNGVAYYRPWIFMITDGEPTDEVAVACQRLKSEESGKHVAFFAVGVEGANITRLEGISVRKPLMLNGLEFAELFVWLSASLGGVAKSEIGEQVALPPAGWSAV